MLAGRQAVARSAHVEAVSHLERGLQQPAPAAPGRGDGRSAARVSGDARPVADPDARARARQRVEAVYGEAVELCERVEPSLDHVAAFWGWWRISPGIHAQLERAERLFGLAERLADPGVLLQAHHCLWATRFNLGDFAGLLAPHRGRAEALRRGRLPRAGRLLRRARRPGLRQRRGGARALASGLARAGAALSASTRSNWSERLGHAGSQLHALDIAVTFRRYRREPEAAREPGPAHDRPRPRARARRPSGQGPAVSRLDRRRCRRARAGHRHDRGGLRDRARVRHARGFLDLLRHPGRDAGRRRAQPGQRWTRSSARSPKPRSAPGRSGCPSCIGAAARCCWHCRHRAPTRPRPASARR